ncbi:MAG: GTPase, partial [Lysobacterales bacterium]
MVSPASLIRWLLFALLAAAVGGTLLLSLLAVDTGLSVWERLQGMPAGFRYLYAALLAVAGLAVTGLGWRLMRKKRVRPLPPAPAPTRESLRGRAGGFVEDGLQFQVEQELAELDRRNSDERIQVAVFGAVNAGKSALIRALAPEADTGSDVIAGTTRLVSHHQGRLADGRVLVLADVPGTQEDAGREQLAREEVLRAHFVLYVCAADLSRPEAAEVAWLNDFGKPFVLVLNQADRYDDSELAQLRQRLHERTGVEVIAASAGGGEQVLLVQDGHERLAWQEREADVERLRQRLARHLRGPVERWQPARESAVLRGLDQRVGRHEAEDRARRADAVVVKYTRRAVVGALAAVAPGSDLVIQGALGTALVRELAGIYEVPVRQIDVDALIDRIGSTLRTSTAVVLAIAGNAAKAFPGVGTIGGGLAHAVAYGLIFDSLGRAV